MSHSCGCTLHVNAAKRKDPTQTGRVRRAFLADINRRFKTLKKQIRETIVKNDALGLKVNAAAGPGSFAFPRSADKVNGFMAWLQQTAENEILGGTATMSMAGAWSDVYIQSAYQQGIAQAGQKMRGAGADVSDRWIDGAFNRPIHADRAGLIYSRTYDGLKGITQAMDTQISRVLTQGIIDGKNPLTIAKEISERVDKIGLTRARVLARTEIISAHAEASINAYQEAGAEGVEVEAEWTTAGDDRVCEVCQALEGRVYPLDKAHGMLPAHPNCRCALIPKLKDASKVVLQ